MAKIKVIWSNRAKKRLYEILEFLIKTSKSKTSAGIVLKEIKARVRDLKKDPDSGFDTNCDNVKGLRIGNYLLFYEIEQNDLLIHTIQRDINR